MRKAIADELLRAVGRAGVDDDHLVPGSELAQAMLEMAARIVRHDDERNVRRHAAKYDFGFPGLRARQAAHPRLHAVPASARRAARRQGHRAASASARGAERDRPARTAIDARRPRRSGDCGTLRARGGGPVGVAFAAVAPPGLERRPPARPAAVGDRLPQRPSTSRRSSACSTNGGPTSSRSTCRRWRNTSRRPHGVGSRASSSTTTPPLPGRTSCAARRAGHGDWCVGSRRRPGGATSALRGRGSTPSSSSPSATWKPCVRPPAAQS